MYTRIFDIIQHQLQTANLEVCLARRVDKKNWTSYSTQDVINNANSVSTAMLQLGFVKGDKIAVIATTNRPEWQFIDLACMQIGVITVPIYPTISEEATPEVIVGSSYTQCSPLQDSSLHLFMHFFPDVLPQVIPINCEPVTPEKFSPCNSPVCLSFGLACKT